MQTKSKTVAFFDMHVHNAQQLCYHRDWCLHAQSRCSSNMAAIGLGERFCAISHCSSIIMVIVRFSRRRGAFFLDFAEAPCLRMSPMHATCNPWPHSPSGKIGHAPTPVNHIRVKLSSSMCAESDCLRCLQGQWQTSALLPQFAHTV